MAAFGRSADAINSVYDLAKNLAETAFSPWIAGVKYMSKHGGEGMPAVEKKELVNKMFGAEEGALTNFSVGDYNLNGAKIAKGAASLGIGYRALSGGGLYRDKDGNTDIAGIPFV